MLETDNILAVAKRIEPLAWPLDPEGSGFSMGVPRHRFGKPSGIVGWSAYLRSPGDFPRMGITRIEKEAHTYLGTNIFDHNDLFFPRWTIQKLISPEMAAYQLRTLAEIGFLLGWEEVLEYFNKKKGAENGGSQRGRIGRNEEGGEALSRRAGS